MYTVVQSHGTNNPKSLEQNTPQKKHMNGNSWNADKNDKIFWHKRMGEFRYPILIGE